MRRASGGALYESEDGGFGGVNLGADYCAEHEWGIARLKRRFEIDVNAKPGIARRQINQLPKGLVFSSQEGRDAAVLAFYKQGTSDARVINEYVWGKLKRYSDEAFTAAWDEGSFAIAAFDEEVKEHLRELHEAFKNNDVALWVGAGGPFKKGGLKLVIVSRLPKKVLDTMLESDKDNDRLQAAHKSTGIEEKLKEAGLDWYALSPKRPHGDIEERTEHDLVYWLNPCDQRANNYGWFTVEELELWAKGSGPIPKRKSE